ncbi:MAG: type II secretion system protein [Bdellovibrionales bacterium]
MTSKLKIKRTFKTRRGFSLSEFAIVLAIMGLVLGALWGVVAIVRENGKRQEMTQIMVVLVQNIRDFYSSRIRVADKDNATDMASVTSYLLQQNVIPSDLIRTRSASTLVADHPWGATSASGATLSEGGILVDGWSNGARFFRIQLRGLEYSSCVALTDRLSGPDMVGLYLLSINGSASHTTLPVSPDVAMTECVKSPSGSQNYMDFVFYLRSQVSK